MTRDVESVELRDSVQTAARIMRDANVGFLPVCNDGRIVVGAITDRDITVRLVAEDRPVSTWVSQVMTREVIACRPEDDLQRAEDLMAETQKSRIVCTDSSGRLLGVISLADLARIEDVTVLADTLRRVKSCPSICCAPRWLRWGSPHSLRNTRSIPRSWVLPRLALASLATIDGHLLSEREAPSPL